MMNRVKENIVSYLEYEVELSVKERCLFEKVKEGLAAHYTPDFEEDIEVVEDEELVVPGILYTIKLYSCVTEEYVDEATDVIWDCFEDLIGENVLGVTLVSSTLKEEE
jgi:hypothetical protein